MAKSNGHCGVGVAYNSRIGGELTYTLEAKSGSYVAIMKLARWFLLLHVNYPVVHIATQW